VAFLAKLESFEIRSILATNWFVLYCFTKVYGSGCGQGTVPYAGRKILRGWKSDCFGVRFVEDERINSETTGIRESRLTTGSRYTATVEPTLKLDRIGHSNSGTATAFALGGRFSSP